MELSQLGNYVYLGLVHIVGTMFIPLNQLHYYWFVASFVDQDIMLHFKSGPQLCTRAWGLLGQVVLFARNTTSIKPRVYVRGHN